MKKILVTGGCGFIGSHLCEKLISEENKVICLDNLYTGSVKKIEHLLNNENFTFIQEDITNNIDIECDQIYNLACPASPVHYQADRIKTTITSVIGIINLLDNAVKYDADILQASTSEVYGDPIIHPQTEEYFGNVNPIGIRSCYDEGKRCAESLMFSYKAQYNAKIHIARIFNTYGTNMSINDGRVISNFIVQALRNEPLTVYGSGNQTRSFCYIDDLINGLVTLMNSDKAGPYNIGNPDEYRVIDIAKLIIKLTNSNSKIIYKELPQDDPLKRKPDITKAMNDLSYNPSCKLESGLINTINYFREIIK